MSTWITAVLMTAMKDVVIFVDVAIVVFVVLFIDETESARVVMTMTSRMTGMVLMMIANERAEQEKAQ